MRRILSLCLLLALTWPCHAQQKPNTLTPKEIADGWILLFDGETTFGWNIDGSAKVAGEVLRLGGEKQVDAYALSYFGPGQLDFEYRWEKKSAKLGTVVRYWLRGDAVASAGYGFLPAEGAGWHRCTLSFHADPKDGTMAINRKHYSSTGSLSNEGSSVGAVNRPMKFGYQVGAGGSLLLRNIKVKPMETVPFFNGADLTGWREFPGKKSKFAVIDNAINVKNGPGDLQTVGKYKDFILQLDCISNGKHLNSGIFFRCRDNEYQNGYEAQIHNGFTETPKKYLIEEYDPQTNKLLGKKEQLFNAIDFGTGAIYRRMPARKQMAKDGEWFGMTIVAHGNHFATWVNGVQVVDWTDNRERKDNARNGCKLEAGHISIQGHDPTTDLSFKNIRIAEFK